MKRVLILSLMFAWTVAYADCQIGDVLQTLRPRSAWTLDGNTYSGLNWLDIVQVKPTQAEVQVATTQCETDDTARKAQKAQAKLDAKNVALTQAQRLQALLILLDFDR